MGRTKTGNTHGKSATYARGCRCQACKAAQADKQRRLYERKQGYAVEWSVNKPIRFDADAIKRTIDGKGLTVHTMCQELRMATSSFNKALAKGTCTVRTLDKVACYLGRHISEFEVAS